MLLHWLKHFKFIFKQLDVGLLTLSFVLDQASMVRITDSNSVCRSVWDLYTIWKHGHSVPPLWHTVVCHKIYILFQVLQVAQRAETFMGIGQLFWNWKHWCWPSRWSMSVPYCTCGNRSSPPPLLTQFTQQILDVCLSCPYETLAITPIVLDSSPSWHPPPPAAAFSQDCRIPIFCRSLKAYLPQKYLLVLVLYYLYV